jgi:hypothetical protein
MRPCDETQYRYVMRRIIAMGRDPLAHVTGHVIGRDRVCRDTFTLGRDTLPSC